MTRHALPLLLFCLIAAERPPDVTTAPAPEQFVIIPLRVHVLSGDA